MDESPRQRGGGYDTMRTSGARTADQDADEALQVAFETVAYRRQLAHDIDVLIAQAKSETDPTIKARLERGAMNLCSIRDSDLGRPRILPVKIDANADPACGGYSRRRPVYVEERIP